METAPAGGAGRVCLLDGEVQVAPDLLRASGDLVHRDLNGNIFYDARRDQTFKRHGMRMNLLELEQVESDLLFADIP